MPTTAPYGSWRSPITTDLMVSGSIGLGQLAVDGEDIYWVEMRSSEGGRMVVVKRTPDGCINDITPDPFSARTRVHEYGGGAFWCTKEWCTSPTSWTSACIGRTPEGSHRPLPRKADLRYADGCFDAARSRIICVREDHTSDGEPVNVIVAVDAQGRAEQRILYQGSDFCSTPRVSPDGSNPDLANLGPSQHALGRNRAPGCQVRRPRKPGRTPDRGRRKRRVDLPARVVARRRAPLRLRPRRLVEPLALGERSSPAVDNQKSRVRQAAVGVRFGHLRLRFGRSDRLQLRGGRRMEDCDAGDPIGEHVSSGEHIHGDGSGRH